MHGLFAERQAKKHGEMIKNDLAERGIEAVPIIQRTGLTACMLMIQVTCEESVAQQVMEVLTPLGMDIMDL